MPLRKCAACGGDLPAGSTARAKFCSVTCRKRANRAKDDALVLSIAPAPVDPEAVDAEVASSRLEALEASAARLVRFLEEADPRSAAPLNKEYRETLRELEAARAEAKAVEGGARERTDRRRGTFDASAI